jgi:hypothetical protein
MDGCSKELKFGEGWHNSVCVCLCCVCMCACVFARMCVCAHVCARTIDSVCHIRHSLCSC